MKTKKQILKELDGLCEIMLLKIVKPSKKNDYDAALEDLPRPIYVLRNTKPGYDMVVYFDFKSMHDDILKRFEEFKKGNTLYINRKAISNKLLLSYV